MCMELHLDNVQVSRTWPFLCFEYCHITLWTSTGLSAVAQTDWRTNIRTLPLMSSDQPFIPLMVSKVGHYSGSA